jgi:hypothetical protein
MRTKCNVCGTPNDGLDSLVHFGCHKYRTLAVRSTLTHAIMWLAGCATAALTCSGCFAEAPDPVDDFVVVVEDDEASSSDEGSEDTSSDESSGDAEIMPETVCETCSVCDTTVWPVVCYDVELCCEVEPYENTCQTSCK